MILTITGLNRTFEALMDERDARENRIREQRDREIAQLPEDEQPAALQAEKEVREKYQADKQLLLEARRGTILAENGRASGSGSSPSSTSAAYI